MAWKRSEKRWAAATIFLFLLYNLPGVPTYGDAAGLAIHGILTVVPLWVITYAGLYTHNRRDRKADQKEA